MSRAGREEEKEEEEKATREEWGAAVGRLKPRRPQTHQSSSRSHRAQPGSRHAKHARGAAFIAREALARVRAGRGCGRGRRKGDLAPAPPRPNSPRRDDSALSFPGGGLGWRQYQSPPRLRGLRCPRKAPFRSITFLPDASVNPRFEAGRGWGESVRLALQAQTWVKVLTAAHGRPPPASGRGKIYPNISQIFRPDSHNLCSSADLSNPDCLDSLP